MGSSSNPNSSSFNFPDHKIYSEQTSAYNEGHQMGSRGSTSSSSSASASSSRRGQSQGQQQQQQQQPMGKCQVEGCGVDLSGTKPYYCKHRVCGPHSKSPRVIVGGLDQRFCQQCSRFHIISEFDQGKRSCRRRLAGHNERRRKPTAGPLLTHPRHFLPFFHDDGNRSRGFIMDFTRPRTAVEFGSSNSNHNVAVVNSNPHDFPQAPTSRPFFPSSNEILAGIPSSSCALSLLSSPVQWSGATGTDSFQNPVGFRGSHEGSTITTSVHTVHQNIGPGIMGRPDQTSQFSGELESALHGNRQSIIGDDNRSYGHSDAGDDGHDVIHWSL